MALGRSALNEFESNRMDIDLICGQKLRNSWNTFQYVARNLDAWADETTVGAKTKSELVQLTEALNNLLTLTNKFINETGKFSERQRAINEQN